MLLISDVHFGINRESEVNRILEAAHPKRSGGCVVIAGDLVQSATESEYKDAGEFVKKLIELGNVVCVTPGNHDFQISGAPDGTGSDKVNFIPTRWDNARKYYREHILAPVLAQECVVARGTEDEEATRYDMLARHGNDLFLCLRSTHRRSFKSTFLGFRSIGRIREKQVTWARNALSDAIAQVETPRIHIVSHRSLWQTHDDKHPPLSRAKRVEKLMQEFDAISYIHGHNHITRFSRTRTLKLDLPVIRLGLPSVCDRVDESQRAFIIWDAACPDVAVSETASGSTQLDIIEEPHPEADQRDAIVRAAAAEDWKTVSSLIAEIETDHHLDNDLALAKLEALLALHGRQAAQQEFESHLESLKDKDIETVGYAASAELLLDDTD